MGLFKKKKDISPEEVTVKSVKKKKVKIRTPMAMTKELKNIGESYTRYTMFVAYVAILSVSIVMGILFKLPVWMVVICGFFYILMTPKLLYNYKKQRFEKKRFDELCAYLSQMNQSFTSTHNVLASLKDTEETFTNGRMKRALSEAIYKIENSYSNVRSAEAEALALIEESFDCEKIRNLHEYLIRAEARGGDCTDEFKVVDRINEVWKRTVLDYYNKMKRNRLIVVLYFGLLLGVCIYLLRNFPDMIDLIGHKVVQFTNMIEIILFIFVFSITDSKLNTSLLRDAKFMSKESADAANDYVNTFDNKKERRKYLPLIILSFIMGGALFALRPTGMTAIISVGFVVMVFNMHKLIFYLNWMIIKKEMTKAFPKWLFDVLLLMQTESVEVSIFNSRDLAPPILMPELNRICQMLDEKPGSTDAYMSFLAEYRIDGVENAMRNLVSIAHGTGNKEVMTTVIEHSMQMLADAEKSSIKNKGDISTAYQFIPLSFMTLGMIVYLVALVLEVFAKLNSVLNI